MKEYIKCLNETSIPNEKGVNFAPLVIWRKGEYYRILKESDKYIWPMNEILFSISKNKIIDNLFENMIALEKPSGARIPLGFIRLTEDEVKAEKEKNN